MQQDLPKSNQAIYSIGRTSGVSVRFLSSFYSFSVIVLMWQSTTKQNQHHVHFPEDRGYVFQ